MEKSAESSPGGTQSIERAISLLRILATRPSSGWGLTALAETAGLKKATVHRILARLELEGLVHRRGADQHYFLGPLLLELSLATPGFHEFIAISKRSMASLAKRTGLAAILSLRSGNESVVAARAGSREGKGILIEVGARRLLMGSTGGAAILAGLAPDIQTTIVAQNLVALKERGGVRIDAIRKLWDRTRKLGFAASFGDIVAGLNSVAVALRVPRGGAIASISLVGLDHQLPEERMAEVAGLIEQEAAAIVEKLDLAGYPFLYID